MSEPILETIKARLQGARGRWPEISKSAAVPYFTITNIAQGRVANPGVQTVQKLLDYFAEEDRARGRAA